MEQERTPAAADVQEPLAGSEAQLAADVVELLHLGRVEGIAVVAEVRARIDHPLVQPQSVERVGHVVVVGDVAAHVALAVQPRLDARLRPVALVLHGPHHGFGDGEHALRTAGEVEVAADVGTRQRTQCRLGQRAHAVPRTRDDLDGGRRRQRHTDAVRQHERDRHVAAAVAARDEMTECFGHGPSPPIQVLTMSRAVDAFGTAVAKF